jgi:hypothetical protein
MRADAWRAIWLILVFSAALFALLKNFISKSIIYPVIALLMVIDLGFVDSRYFSKEKYVRKRDNTTFAPTPADEEILKDKSYYRVFNIQGAFTDARTSYFHNSIGGYHGAKMRRYQELYDSGIVMNTQMLMQDVQQGTPQFSKYGVLNMLNTKYIVYGSDKENIIGNPEASGPAWFVKELILVSNATEELNKTREVNTRVTAVIDNSIWKLTSQSIPVDSVARINLVDNRLPYMKYESESASNGVVVFSEVFYPKGWHAFIDGKEVTILRANYILRALEVPAGKHTIEFRFEPKPYTVGNKVSMGSGWILLIVVVGSLMMSLKKE